MFNTLDLNQNLVRNWAEKEPKAQLPVSNYPLDKTSLIDMVYNVAFLVQLNTKFVDSNELEEFNFCYMCILSFESITLSSFHQSPFLLPKNNKKLSHFSACDYVLFNYEIIDMLNIHFCFSHCLLCNNLKILIRTEICFSLNFLCTKINFMIST